MSQPAVVSDVAVLRPGDVVPDQQADHAPSLMVHSFGMSDPGKVRRGNEDQFLIAVLDKALRVRATSLPQPKVQHSDDQGYLFVVADGMGGHAAGKQASALAIDSVETFILETFQWFARCKSKEADGVLAEFQNALGQANTRILAEGARHPEWHGMGTTLTLAYSLNDQLHVAHVGDSRCYLFHHGTLYRLTSDHTLVEEMVRRGVLNAEEAAGHQWRHVITNAVGGDTPEVKVEVHKVHLEAGDRVLLCSDGLTEMVSDDEIARVLDEETAPEPACQRLVARANEAGGKDNTTVILASYLEAPSEDSRY
jgi:protein phosphatase